MARTKISASRRRVDTVMANPEWKSLTVKRGNIEVSIPQDRIVKSNGLIYKSTQELLDEGYKNGFTKEIADALDRTGVDLFVTIDEKESA